MNNLSQKKSIVKNLRNVLGTPFNIQWSESNPEGVASLEKALEELLPLARLESRSLKLQSRHKTKEKSLSGTPSVERHQNIFRSYLCPGFQSVIRRLERNDLCCVLMSGDITPPMIPRVVCSYCSTYDVPLMIAPNLKTITKSSLGFPTMVLGLKKIADSTENPFFPIHEIASQNRSIIKTPFISKHNGKKEAQDTEDKCIVRNEKSCLSFVYLYRDSSSDRVFRPAPEVDSRMNSQVRLPPKDGLDGDFISFSKSEIKSSKLDLSNRNISTMIDDKNYSEDDDSNCDSLDEDNIFYVDNQPNNMLLGEEPSNNKNVDTQVDVDIKQLDMTFQSQEKGNSTKNKAKMSERYFSGKVKQDEKPNKVKNKEKKDFKQKNKVFMITDKKEKQTSSTYSPLTIKTVIKNPKKIRRKKK